MSSTKVDRYVMAKAEEDKLKQAYEAAKKERIILMEELVGEMDAGGVAKYYASSGEGVSQVRTVRARVVSHSVLMNFMQECGLKEDYVVERFRFATSRQDDKPGINDLAKEAQNKAVRTGEPIEKFLPPGLGVSVDLTLRITKPKVDSSSQFEEAGKSIIEILQEDYKGG